MSPLRIIPLILILASHTLAHPCPASYKFPLGPFNITILSDGPLTIPFNPFFTSDTSLEQSYRSNFRSTDPILWPQNIPLIRTSQHTILIDTGSFHVPEFPILDNAGRLHSALEAVGVKFSDIDVVVVTHAHPDHLGGLLLADGSAAFPNAYLYVSEREHKFFFNGPLPTPDPSNTQAPIQAFAQIYRRSVTPYLKSTPCRLRLLSDHANILPGISLLPAHGHTPGHSMVRVSSQDESLIIAADTWFTMADQLSHPAWGQGFDLYPAQAARVRARLLGWVAKSGQKVLVYHEQFPGLGHVKRSGDAYAWISAERVEQSLSF